MNFKAGRPSPGLIIAAIALTFAVAGTAIAADPVAKLNRSKVKTIAQKQVNKLAPGLSVGNSDQLDNLNSTDFLRSNAKADDADTLDNLNSTDFLRSNAVFAEGEASSNDVDNFTTTTYTNILSEPFTAPTAGFALITTSVGAADDTSIAGDGALWSRIAIDGTATTNDTFNNPTHDGPFVTGGGTATNTAVVPVTAGAHTAHLQIRNSGTGSYVYSRQITVLFVPSGEATAIPYSRGDDGQSGGPQG